jgi:hypothetical protein
MSSNPTDPIELINALRAELDALKLSTSVPATPVATPKRGTPAATLSELIGLSDFLPTERSTVELENATLQVISKTERISLSSADRTRAHSAHTKGLLNKFKAISTIAGLDRISTIDNLVSFSQQRLGLQKHICGISANDVFFVLKFNTLGEVINPDSPEGAPVNLLTTTLFPSLQDVERSTRFYNSRGSAFNRENLTWTYESIRNSCDQALQEIIDAKMLQYTTSDYFGPLYYYHLIHQMTNVDSKAVRSITKELADLDISTLEGQSITHTVKLIRATVRWLSMVSMLPPDITTMVLGIFETCTVPDFQLYLKALITNADLNSVTLSVESILSKVESQYRTLVLSKKWDALGNRDSVFYQGGQAERAPNTQRTSRDRNNNSNGTRINMPSWSRTPPAAGEPVEKLHEGQTFKYCDTCRRWFYGTRGHFTADHRSGQWNRSGATPSTTPGATTTPRSTTVPPIAAVNSAASDRAPLEMRRNYFSAGF